MKTSNKPILITGSHRSGSTWAGKMIASSPLVAYIPEPFNIYCRPGICNAQFDYWFTYVCDNNEHQYYSHLNDTIKFKYHLLEELNSSKSIKDILRLLRDGTRFFIYRINRKRPLLKDPIALFSAEWLAQRFDMDVIVLIRHPAAFVGSLKKANWPHPFTHFLQQPLLMKHHLNEFEYEIREFAEYDKDIIDQGILLWNLIHHMILKYKEKCHEWIFVKHEELSKYPVSGFGKIFHRLNLDYPMNVQKVIKTFSSSINQNGQQTNVSLKRDSKANIWSWKNRLTKEEIRRIKEKTYPIASKFYSEKDWNF